MTEARRVRPSFETIEAYWRSTTSGLIAVTGAPQVWFVVDPLRAVLAIRVVADAERLNVGELRRVFASTFEEDRIRYFELAVAIDQNLLEAVAFLGSVADRIQLGGERFSDAVKGALSSYGRLLASVDRMSEEQEIGLLAELATLLALMRSGYGPDAASMWLGSDREEHDFRLPSTDVEVKCTRAERAAHWISSVSQLVPSKGRTLHLLSVRVTSGTADIGSTLPQMVEVVLREAGKRANEVERRLQPLYRRGDEPWYLKPWSLRSSPSFYLIDNTFPSITPDRVQNSVPHPELVLDVRYRIDVSTLPVADEVFPTTAFTLTQEATAT